MNWPTIVTALVTPYDPTGEVNPVQAADLARKLWYEGSDGFVVAGSTGEAYGLSLSERERLFRAVRAALPAEVPVWIGTGSNDTRETIRLTEAADSWGADGMLIVAPYYNKPPAAGLVSHFREAARHTTRPVMIYDVPGRTGVQIPPEVVVEAHRQAANILAVKEAAGTITAMIAMHRALPPEVMLYSGDDALLLPSLAVGATGIVSVASHVAAGHMRALVEAYRSGRQAEAIRLHEVFWPLANALFLESNPIPLKWLMNRLGLNVGGVRPPLAMGGTSRLEPLWEAYQHLNGNDDQSLRA